jgi:hypothetical protein
VSDLATKLQAVQKNKNFWKHRRDAQWPLDNTGHAQASVVTWLAYGSVV